MVALCFSRNPPFELCEELHLAATPPSFLHWTSLSSADRFGTQAGTFLPLLQDTPHPSRRAPHTHCIPSLSTAPKLQPSTPPYCPLLLTLTLTLTLLLLPLTRYIRNLFVLVVAYGMSINMVEVTWKGKLKQVS